MQETTASPSTEAMSPYHHHPHHLAHHHLQLPHHPLHQLPLHHHHHHQLQPHPVMAAAAAAASAIKYETSPRSASSRTPSPHLPVEMTTTTAVDVDVDDVADTREKYVSDDEISVGCPSPMASSPKSPAAPPPPPPPAPPSTTVRRTRTASLSDEQHTDDDVDEEDEHDGEDYFKPLKRLKMLDIEQEQHHRRAASRLHHHHHLHHNHHRRASIASSRPDSGDSERRISPTATAGHAMDDEDDVAGAHHAQQPQLGGDAIAGAGGVDQATGVKSFSIMDILNHRPAAKTALAPARIVRPWDLDPDAEAQQHLERFHRHLKAQQLALLRPEFAAAAAAAAAAGFGASYASETGSDRSSSVASDCCSPDIVPHHARHHHHQQHAAVAAAATASQGQQQQQAQGGRAGAKTTPSGTPLDALFQMTSKTFDSNTAESSADGQNHLNLFNNRQQPKKKRKSRTAFTNHQIFELEKRFLYQKYLSPADRDEIAASLGLTNAQVITWFQNRRAKLKRDMEELKKDVESAKILTAHKSFLENVQDLGILKKKAMLASAGGSGADDDCPKNLVIAHEK